MGIAMNKRLAQIKIDFHECVEACSTRTLVANNNGNSTRSHFSITNTGWTSCHTDIQTAINLLQLAFHWLSLFLFLPASPSYLGGLAILFGWKLHITFAQICINSSLFSFFFVILIWFYNLSVASTWSNYYSTTTITQHNPTLDVIVWFA